MLQLKNIKKDYYVAGKPVPALKGINLTFKQQEFVSILGPSGCGKTTMLNLIGGLDRYSSGDLMINGKSTKGYKDQDWDAYRNATIGFVFQSYNLISHLSVLDNVEMALRLSGVGAKERKERSIKVLEDVGLQDQIYKRPNQLSGGQMQRVAIARALVNDPKILLADEPTGALDSKTSDQIMKLIKEISKDRLVIMVTHNSEIANEYSDRVVQLLDGLVVDDSNPSENADELDKKEKLVNKKTSMNYLTALLTSFNNLLTKKGRTLITALAGSIGIIGIALVLSVSTGMTAYVEEMQSDTLAGFPLTIDQNVFTDFFSSRQDQMTTDGEFPTDEIIYSYDRTSSLITHTNIITDEFINYLDQLDDTLYNSISYTRSIQLHMMAQTSAGGYAIINTNSSGGSMFSSSYFNEIPDNMDFIESQYDLLSGEYPQSYTDVVLVVDSNNRLDVDFLDQLGVSIVDDYQFDDFVGYQLKVIPNNTFYQESNGVYSQNADLVSMYQSSEAITLTVTGILRVNPDASSELLDSGIAYTKELTDYMLNDSMNSDVVTAQLANVNQSVVAGFTLSPLLTYDTLIKMLGGDATPTGVQIYPVSFEAKDEIKAYLDSYNEGLSETDAIVYSDLAETVSNAIGSLIDTITIILSAFAGISLVVSSIMIGIITYVSVVERTKEIGIMRSLGARKKDISRIFNAETILIGFTAGLLGVLIAWLLTIPINLLLERFIEVSGFAQLLFTSAAILVILSTFLTLIAGLFPSSIAAKKDPVIALRTE